MTTAHRPGSPITWGMLVSFVVALLALAALVFSPPYALIPLFWVMCVWAAFWVIRLAVRYGVNDALQSNRHWMSAPDRDRIEN